jgi:DNA polymerase-3 subunit epsilon
MFIFYDLPLSRFSEFNIRPMTLLSDLPVLILDCQATGPATAGGRLLEIGWTWIRASEARACSPDQVTTFRFRLPAGEAIPRRVQRVTGIDENTLEGGVAPGRAWQRLLQTDPVRPIPTVIHFARFERPFLCRLHDQKATAEPFPLDILCTHEVVRRLLPELPRKGLRAVAGYFNHAMIEQRRCAAHVAATARIWFHLQRLLADRTGIVNWPDLAAWLEKTEIPTASRSFPMERGKIDALPDRSGVYRMRRKNGGLLYIGKAASLRKRVASYFRPRARHAEHILEMLTQARDLEVSETATALAAALQEADEIRRLSPPYNRALRTEGKTLVFVSADFTRTGVEPDDAFRIGPLPGERVAEGLCALSRICSRWSARRPVGGAEAAAALCVEPGRLPDDFLLREGVETFFRRHRQALSRDSVPQSMMKIARMVWKQKMAAAEDARPEAGTEEETVESSLEEPEWTPERVAGRFEGILCHCGRMIRRSRWFVILGDSSLAWTGPNGDRSFRNLIVFRQGAVEDAGMLVRGQPLPAPPGLGRPGHLRREGIDLAVYQRLRVATTEIRRLLVEERDPVLRVSGRVILGPAQLARMLWWV